MRAKSPTDVRLELCPRNLRNTSNLVGSLILLSVSHAPIDAMYFLDGRAKIKFSFVSQVRWSIFRFECRTDGAYILLRTPRSECHMRIEMAAQLEILTLCGLLTLYTSTKRILASSCFLTNAFPYSFSLTIFFRKRESELEYLIVHGLFCSHLMVFSVNARVSLEHGNDDESADNSGSMGANRALCRSVTSPSAGAAQWLTSALSPGFCSLSACEPFRRS